MKRLLVPLLVVAVILTVLYSVKEAVRAIRETVQFEQDTARLFTQVEVDRIVHDSTIALNARADSIAQRLLETANRQSRSIQQLQLSNQRLRGALDSATNAPDSLQIAITALETYRVALDTAQAIIDGYRSIVRLRDSQLVQLSRSERLGWVAVDSLQSLIRRTPTCRKIPILGISVPKLGIGYFATTGGHGIGVGVFVPLGKC